MAAAVGVFAYTRRETRDDGKRVRISEFKRWLQAQGVIVTEGANHWKLYFNGRQSVLPRHPGKELKEGTRRAILKQLGL